MKRILIIAISILFSTSVFAQNSTAPKIGYVNVEYLMSAWPEVKKLESELMTSKSMYEKDLETKYKEFETKKEAFEKGQAMMSDIVKADRQKELEDLLNRIELMENNAKMGLMKKQEELLAPLLDKIEATIKIVAEEKGYTHVFQSSANGTSILLYAKNEQDNLTKAVALKLGITIPDDTQTGSAGTAPVGGSGQTILKTGGK